MFPSITFSIENPLNSYLWLFEQYLEIASRPGWHFVTYQGCMHGGTRPKWSAWLTNVAEYLSLHAVCDASHTHEPYDVKHEAGSGWSFASAAEAAYPRQLCDAAAILLLRNLARRGSSSRSFQSAP